MKRITRIIISFCLMLLLTEGVNGQVRFGVESNVGLGPYYYYDRDGFFEDKERANLLLYSTNFFTDIIFPRKWTPNWMALSMQIGLGFMEMNYNDSYMQGMASESRHSIMSRGFNFPLGVDVKLLISSDVRFFLSGGVVNYINIAGDLGAGFRNRAYLYGLNYGTGFEFGPLRISYKLTSFPKTINKGNLGNKYSNIHTLNMGIMFNGNRFLKKKSYLKVY